MIPIGCPPSLDLTLAPTFRVFRKVHEVIEVPQGQGIMIMAGETVLGITHERLRLGPGVSRLVPCPISASLAPLSTPRVS